MRRGFSYIQSFNSQGKKKKDIYGTYGAVKKLLRPSWFTTVFYICHTYMFQSIKQSLISHKDNPNKLCF